MPLGLSCLTRTRASSCSYEMMLTMSQVWESIRAVRGKNPKTVLGFLWGVGALAVAAFMGYAWACAANAALLPGLVFVGVVCALIVVAVLAVTVVAMFVDPSRLLLTTVEASDYVDIQRMLRLGDSSTGERTVPTIEDVETLRVVENSASAQIEETAGEEA